MNIKFSRFVQVLLGAVVIASVFTSCSRGGYGCPYEIEAAIDLTNCLLN